VNRIYPKGEFDMFAGDQVVLVGRYHTPGKAKVKLKGKLGSEETTFDFPAELDEKSSDDTNAFVAKLWATRRVGDIIDELDLKGKNDELVKELVALATEQGILTPYTSFLADETSNVRDLTSNFNRAGQQVESLQEISGRYAFEQRGAKLRFQAADQAPAAALSAPVPAATPGGTTDSLSTLALSPARSSGGGYFGGNVTYYDAAMSTSAVASNCRQIGRKTFFQRGDRLVDSSVTADQEKAAKKIERYSPEYFALVEKYGKHVAQYLALDEHVVINLGDETYEW
jgi:Ca-activated chloride channel family protein